MIFPERQFWSVCSTGTTAFAPSGSGAPVMMRAASPASRARVGMVPAGMSATTRRRAGLLLFRALRILRDHGETVHAGIGEWRRIERCPHIGTEYATQTLD